MTEATITLSDILAILGAIGTIAGIIGAFVAYKKGLAKDSSEGGKTYGILLSDIGYIKSSTDEIKSEQKEQRKVNTEVITRLTAVEQSSKQAHYRIDRIEKKPE